jgi:hypothetical protein
MNRFCFLFVVLVALLVQPAVSDELRPGYLEMRQTSPGTYNLLFKINDKVTPLDRVPLLVRSKGAEIGVRTKAIDGLTSTLAVFVLDFDSELLFVCRILPC